ncbi:MAG: leucine-rich repeat protein [Lachnospiraceae bacterium]|nr:leucine-rich repeat protein [Lachnospiraceae bacterium]
MKKCIGKKVIVCFIATVICCVFSSFVCGTKKASAANLEDINPVVVDETTFPDPAFRTYVSEEFDKDHDGTLSVDEIVLARNIWADGLGIKSLKGIEYLVELRGLYASHNELTELDLSGNQEITGVWVAYNNFTSLDFSSTPTLEWVYCFYCPYLTNLDVTGNPEMSYIECNSSPVGNLDLSHNPKLEHLMCGDCEMTNLDLSHNPLMQHLDAFRNHFTSLDVTCCPLMKRLDIWDNPGLGSIDVSKCPGLQYYNCSNNDVIKMDVSNNPELTKLICSYNEEIEAVDVSHNPKLVYLDCAYDFIDELDISNNPNLQFLQVFINDFTELNIGNNQFLVKTYNEGVKVQENPNVCGAAHSWTLDFGGETSTGGDNIYFLVVDDKVTLKFDKTKEVVVNHPVMNLDGVDTSKLLTREAVVEILYEMAGKPDVSGLTSRFTDVVPGTSYYNALLWGEKNAVCKGYPNFIDDTFGVGEYVNTQDMLYMVMSFVEYVGYRREIDFGRSDEFIDYFDVDPSRWEAVCWAATWRIFMGQGDPETPKSEKKIEPYGPVTKQQFVNIIDNTYDVNNVYKVAYVDSNGTISFKVGEPMSGVSYEESPSGSTGGLANNGSTGGSTGDSTSGGTSSGTSTGGSSSGITTGGTTGGSTGDSTSGGSSNGTTTGGSSNGTTGVTTGGSTGGSTSGGSSNGTTTGGSSNGTTTGGTTGGSTGGTTSGGSSTGSSTGSNGGATTGGNISGTTTVGTTGGSTGGSTSGGSSSGTTTGGNNNGSTTGGSSSETTTGNSTNGTTTDTQEVTYKVGDIVFDKTSNAKYKITAYSNKKHTVEYLSYEGTKNKVKVPATITVDGITFKVTTLSSSAFKLNQKITSITLGDNLTKIDTGSFSGCTALKSITIGSSVKTIGKNAFKNCSSLEKITIPENVKTIKKSIFSGCKKLKKLVIRTKNLTTKSVSAGTFKSVPTSCKVSVPAEILSAYDELLKSKGLSKKITLKKLK